MESEKNEEVKEKVLSEKGDKEEEDKPKDAEEE